MPNPTTSTFLEACWSSAPDDYFFLIWTMPDKRSRWFRTSENGIRSASETIDSLNANDVYLGVGLASQSYGSRQRVSSLETAGIAGLWADIDHESPGAHKKPNLPPTMTAAKDFLLAAAPEPTVLVHSGNGLQAWWLFDRPWIFRSSQEQAAAADLAKRWTDSLRSKARDNGWDVDATHDLARVMRVPGTNNHKTDPPKPVELIHVSENRYPVGDLRDLVKAPPIDKVDYSLTVNTLDVGFTLAANAAPPFHKWEALRKADKMIERTWRRDRRDFGDQSPSGYDMALANFAAMADWEDQEIVDLLIAHRAEHGDDLKLGRPDYYARTLRKARDSTARSTAADSIDATLHEMDVAPPEEKGEARSSLLDFLSPILKTGVTRVERYNTEPATFRMLTEAGWVHLGTVSELLSQNHCRAAIGEVTRTMFDRMKAAEWDKIAEAIIRAAEEVDVGPEPSTQGSTHGWLEEYLEQHVPASEPDESVILARVPFMKEDENDVPHVHIVLAHFRAWLERSDGEKLNRNQMAMRLRLTGAEPIKLNCTLDRKVTTRSVWRLPATYTG